MPTLRQDLSCLYLEALDARYYDNEAIKCNHKLEVYHIMVCDKFY